ncbi:BAR-domain-containing protein [Basidiobolus meristosporus CBS 931.73]|uniref:BAR-domain-containing protein n=1 Tax=Basidiobolus meristosporus CBS 931.73 TaxID=1314790 RepID=A0A1Y1YVU5_9FUNG|nr:BAR-domain-containing protein [Basidiobolus meristosporus CBS 931.73]|eukprot:ORY01847.1 BAR-domain-containing protein [Basidiobolus meristosporus CBS 931.73]
MSWKGFKKAVERLPSQMMSKVGRIEETVDPELKRLVDHFSQLEAAAIRLNADAIKYRDSIVSLLDTQASFGNSLVDLYNPISDTLDPEAAPSSTRRPTTPKEKIQTAEFFRDFSEELRNSVLPEVDMIDSRVVSPTRELMDMNKHIRKLLVKCDHKRIDYDRHRDSMKKLRNKNTRSLDDEKKIYKLEGSLEQASNEYFGITDLVKRELPVYTQLNTELVKPCFHAFYFLQSSIFSLLYSHLHDLTSTGAVDMSVGVVAGYEARRGPSDALAEEMANFVRAKMLATSSVSSALHAQNRYGSSYSTHPSSPQFGSSNEYPPPYSHVQDSGYPEAGGYQTATNPYARSPTMSSSSRSVPPAASAPPSNGYVIALYDFEAQSEGDLSFRKDDKIEVLERTDSQNDWWQGRLHGVVGLFPGNYVADL